MGSKTHRLHKTARILVVDDHPSVCEALGSRIDAQPDMSCCGQAAGLGDALRQIKTLQPDLVIVDISLKSGDGLDLIKEIAAKYKQIRMLVHSMYDETTYAHRCLHAGAMGFVNKAASPAQVIEAIRHVLGGGIYLSDETSRELLRRSIGRPEPGGQDPVETLTDRQLEVFRLLGDGLTTAQIAGRLHISTHTVETHRENIKQKLGVRSVAALTQRAVQWVMKSR
jgi:DNA-binding NarL/FixJ family response regulator